jgi:hypothetical protein
MSEPKKSTITRREFATTALLTGAAATLAAIPTSAQTPTPAPAPAAQTLSPQSTQESELRVSTILALYPDRFSADQKADLRKISASSQQALDHLRAYQVQNSDEPALHLKPLIEREKKSTPIPNAVHPAASAKKP